ncbi:DUF924 family protein [Pseudoteredinibacter isoporae]|uniref:Uncharacterized protein (DUF924 family) n=1 Tax=Pseudoteredinibacter isoporae TaxID=570281 RepID=A0A7X0JVH6_9GAMM|nr:DUF924 family protein [Pseudoteredinibacter isoporae]MBB6523018.1 uncharacterized protein (DUF924 family) [Pseudoteredinibacter isoporae]NHO88540.1 DUF924 domain-containing protein [Pseudoteredinibacter isoporae]NIB22769.1 DUF924 domain-containing protein [Pseudoteredinibacter isoporae]
MKNDVISFWFEEIQPKNWWQKDEDFDRLIEQRFGSLHAQAKASELFAWRDDAYGSLAEIIVLDQFSRNIYRDRPESFACDPMALALAQTAISKGFDLELSESERGFIYLPFMHSESKVIHEKALELYEAMGNEGNLDFELRHKAIIDQFGRYPHRNTILGRESTPEEIAFLKQPGSSF